MRRSSVSGLIGAAIVAMAAGARAEDGVWIGREIGVADAGVVVVERRGDSLVVSEPAGVWLATMKVDVGGPGTKGGELQLHVDLTAQGLAARAGATLRGVKKGLRSLAKWREDPAAGRIRFCQSAWGLKVVRPASATEVAKGVRCYELARMAAPVVDAPAPTPPEPSFECMRECRQHNMMRAVSPEVIDEDCRRLCTSP